jgi:hypothetical protein
MPERRQLFRIAAESGIFSKASLSSLIEADSTLKNYFGRRVEDGGVDIEGLAEREGQLFVGLRSPSQEGQAFVLETNATDLFNHTSKLQHRLHRLELGADTGIRDLARVRDGFLLIAGNSASDEASTGAPLYHWQGPEGALTRLGVLPVEDGKPEGLLIIDETDRTISLLVLHDGSEDGRPFEVKLTRPDATTSGEWKATF